MTEDSGVLLSAVSQWLSFAGIDGVGLGLGNIPWASCGGLPTLKPPCLALVKLIEDIVRSEHRYSPQRPIYLVGESLGGCLALAVASRNPGINLVLILGNPATSFARSPLQLLSMSQRQLLLAFMEVMQSQTFPSIPFGYPMRGDTLRLLTDAVKRAIGRPPAVDALLQGLHSLSLYYSVIVDILPINTLLWKIEMLKDASAYANSRLNAIKAQTLILTSAGQKTGLALNRGGAGAEGASMASVCDSNCIYVVTDFLCSGRDPLFPSQEEGERLRSLIPNCAIRKFNDKGHFLFLEDGVDLMYTVKGASFYRRGKRHDYASDYLPPNPSDFERVQDNYSQWLSNRELYGNIEFRIIHMAGADGLVVYENMHNIVGSMSTNYANGP
ncbi:hypothetical protein Cgig2_021285 [Carnegiea gigantea]|uniref:AB hydrolase-1 domain-containing protein n=1 Tax=Carnegiea gigantea TaxID=171969 RepID=A0A9Q1GNC1_9CARY|nr:hypothetical protein Cgig2_021285 [Carnegiea gigantea]